MYIFVFVKKETVKIKIKNSIMQVNCPVTDEDDESIDNTTGCPDVPEEKRDNCSDSETKLCPVEQQVQDGLRGIYR